MTQYALVGNSIAANSAATRIHSLDPEGAITLYTDEPHPYYSRCALMYYAMDHCWKRDLYLGDDEHYRRLNARMVCDRVQAVDAAAHELHLASGTTAHYDKLLLACGAVPRRVRCEGEDAAGVHDFTSLADCEQIMAEGGSAKRAVVIGGGLIGAEVAEVFSTWGIPVDLLEVMPHYFPIYCSKDQSDITVASFRQHGVEPHFGVKIARFEKGAGGRVSAVVEEDGTRHEADIVVRAIGVDPNIEFLADSGIELGAGVLVDDTLSNRAGEVWAAGDCAEIQFPDQARPVVQKLWYAAQPQGWIAGENMAGGNARYDSRMPTLSAMFMDLDVTGVGDMPAPWNDLQEHNLTAANGVDSVRLIHDGAKIVGACHLGTALTKEDLEHMVASERSLEDAIGAVNGVFRDRVYDRAPVNRIAERRPLSQRPLFWPFGPKKTWRN